SAEDQTQAGGVIYAEAAAQHSLSIRGRTEGKPESRNHSRGCRAQAFRQMRLPGRQHRSAGSAIGRRSWTGVKRCQKQRRQQILRARRIDHGSGSWNTCVEVADVAVLFCVTGMVLPAQPVLEGQPGTDAEAVLRENAVVDRPAT